MLVSVGERISNALCAMAIRDLGHEAVSLTGSQAGIVTDTVARQGEDRRGARTAAARRARPRPHRPRRRLPGRLDRPRGDDARARRLRHDRGRARGGARRRRARSTPTSKASSPPTRASSRTRCKLTAVSYEEMLEMAATRRARDDGAVGRDRAQVRCAAPRALRVRRQARERGSARRTSWCSRRRSSPASRTTPPRPRRRFSRVPDEPGIAARVFRALADAGVNIDMIVQNVSADGHTDITFTLPKTDLADRGADPRRSSRSRSASSGVVYDADIAKVSPRRRGDEEPSGRRGRHVRGARGRRHQHRDHLDVVDPDLLRRPRRRRRARGAARCTRSSGCSPRSASMSEPRIAVVGATGAVGQVTLRLLRERGYERRARLRVGAVGRARRSTAAARSRRRRPRRSRRATSTSRSSPSARPRRASSCRTPCAAAPSVVDKSSAYRLEPGIPLVVPEVNGARALEHDGIVANPNCCTIPLTCVLKPLHDAAGLRRVRVSTYQSVSGAGAQRMEQLRARAAGRARPRDGLDWDGDETDEESKIRAETQKILELPDLPLSATTVRVPMLVGHAEAVWIELEDPLSAEQATRAAARRAVGARRRRADARARPRRPTRCSSAGSAPTAPPRTASCSSSRATTSSRAPRSTPSRSPSCC